MPKLMDPDTGRTVFATREGAEVLLNRGRYVLPGEEFHVVSASERADRNVWDAVPGLPPEDVERAKAAAEPAERPPKVGPGSGRDQWAAYAAVLGIQVMDSMSRADIIAIIETREQER